MARQVFLLTLLLAGGFSAHIPKHYGAKHPTQYGSKIGKYTDEEPNYEFVYGVKDRKTGNDFGHQETREGHSVTGEYRVLLPDGRTQIVSYVADHDGYRAQVSYIGNVKPSVYRPSFPPISSKPTRPPRRGPHRGPHAPTPVKVKKLYKPKLPTTTPKPKYTYRTKSSTHLKPIITFKPKQISKTLRPNTSRPKVSYLKSFDQSPYSHYPGPYGPDPYNYQPEQYSYPDIPYPSSYDDISYSPYYPTAPEPYTPGQYPPGPYPPSPYFPPTLATYTLGKDAPNTTPSPTTLYFKGVPYQEPSSLFSLFTIDDKESLEI